MALDFLSSDIVFPSDSSEPKLATGVVTKLPEPVDWAFHDYYSTASEKASMPLHSLADYCFLEPVQSNTKHNVKPSAAAAAAAVEQIVPPAQDHQQYLRAILCGALEAVNNSMQDNHLTRLNKVANTSLATKEDWRWEDDIMDSSSDFHFPQQQQQDKHHELILSSSSSLRLDDIDDDEDDYDDDYPSPVYVEDAEDDLMSSGLTSLIISALPSPPTPPAEELVFQPSLNDQVPYFCSIPSPPPAIARAKEDQGKPVIAKSKVWKNLVSRLKKNLASPLANNKKESPTSTHKQQQQHLPSNPLKRFFKTRLH